MPQRSSRNISLPAELDAFIAERLADGEYGNASEVVRAGLRLLRRQERPTAPAGEWPVGGGACGAMIRAMDWSRTPLGPIADWSAELRATVSNVVNSPVAKVLMWGADHIMIYNDAYREIAGANHPRALGGTVPGIWPEIWGWNRGVLEAGFRGETLSYRDQVLTLSRGGAPADSVFDLFYTPVYQADGTVGGVLCTCVDNTARAMAERALSASEAELRAVTDALPVLVSFIDRDHVFRFANRHYVEWFGLPPDQVIGRHARDVIGARNYDLRHALMDRALAGETIDDDAVITNGAGEQRRVNIRYLPRRDGEGHVTGFQVLVIDLEDRALREEALAASNSRFKSHHNAFLLRCLEDFCAMHGQQCLVGRNDVLAVFNGFEHQLFCHGVATNQLYNHVNIGARYGGKSIVYDFYSIASNRFCVCQITVCHQHNFYAPPHAGADFCLIAAQYVKYARANGANA